MWQSQSINSTPTRIVDLVGSTYSVMVKDESAAFHAWGHNPKAMLCTGLHQLFLTLPTRVSLQHVAMPAAHVNVDSFAVTDREREGGSERDR